MAKKFDIGDFLKAPEGVSGSNTEQIVLIDVDRIDPDPDNFYSLDGIDALAGNIELIGLQQPLRVRPNGERFTVVSGHRRRAAILMIRDGGSDMFKAGVPCIVEYGEASDAMRKLRLIYANSATRVMTPSEISRQAEEVQRLLYELKEQGVEFPGRMRDHVAEACKISASKLARLHAIRNNLIPEILAAFDAGKVNEDVAYNLSRFPEDLQQAVAERMAQPKVTRWPYGSSLAAVLKDLDKYKGMSCPAKAGTSCRHLQQKILHNMFVYEWEMCRPNKCCLDCAEWGKSCGFMCEAGHERVKLNKAVEKEKREKQLADAAANEARAQKKYQKIAANLVRLAERAGLKDNQDLYYGKCTVGTLRKIAAGEAKGSEYTIQPYSFSEAKDWCAKLKCSMSELAGEKVEAPAPQPAETKAEPEDEIYTAFRFKSGKPTGPFGEGYYAVRLSMYDKPLAAPRVLWWDGESWINSVGDDIRQRPIDRALHVEGWFPLPDLEESEE